jgi:hypothetical protein
MAVISVSTLAEQMKAIRTRIRENNTVWATQPGSTLGDSLVSPQAISDVKQNAITFLGTIAMSITDLLALKKDDNTLSLLASALETTTDEILVQIASFLDSWGENFDEVRKPASKATGTILYSRIDAPTADITIGVGKTSKRADGVQYATTASVTMQYLNAGSYWNSSLMMYSIEVSIEAAQEGAAGNTAADTITTPVSAVEGLPYVTNTSAVDGGRDLESDEDFGARLLEKWQAIGATTKAGLKDTVIGSAGVAGVLSAYVALTGDALSLRGNGKTDVWFQGELLTEYSEYVTAYNSPDFQNGFVPTKKPAISLVSVGSGTAVLRRDTTSPLAGSIQGKDVIQFTTPPASLPVMVTYLYDSRVTLVQDALDNEARSMANQISPSSAWAAVKTPVLAKRANPLEVDYTAAITVMPNANATQVKLAVKQAIKALEVGYLLNGEVFLTDINQVVEETEGVLRISGSPTKFNLSNKSGVVDSVAPGLNEYVRFKNINIL